MASHAEQAISTDRSDDGARQRKQDIIDAAGELLREDGLEGLTIRAVLKRTGLARRAFYERFAGKDDLVLAVFDQTLTAAAVHFTEQIAHSRDPLERIQLIIQGLIVGALVQVPAFGEKRISAIIREHLRLAETRPAELQKALRPLLTVIAEEITAGIRAGQLRTCDPALQAALIYNLVATTLHTELLMKESGEATSDRRQRLAEEIWEFCRRAIVA